MLKAAFSLLVILASAAAVPAAEVDYLRDVKPLLARRCFACHGPLKQENGLRLDAIGSIRQGGDGGPAIAEGDSGQSLIMTAVRGTDGWQMPPEGEPLSPEEIAILEAWIQAGAVAPDEQPPADPRTHWAFQTPSRPALPASPGPAANPIDRFIDHALASQSLAPLPRAEKHVLLRRVYLDLIGLPPTRAELNAFLADPSPDAYQQVVDRLLADPRYGERWGRHWMDVWRYSDWAGYGAEVRDSQRHIWRWRDWIIQSLNADRGYDRMVVEMLAGDELDPDNPDTLRATGFLARNWFMFNRNVWLDNTVEHTAKAFLGLTINCARCHDHMYDPIAQEDYYQFRAFFEAHDVRTDRVPGQSDRTKDGLARVYDAKAETPTYLFVRGNEAEPDTAHPLQPGVPDALAAGGIQIEPLALPSVAYNPGLRPFIQEETRAERRTAVESATQALAAARQALAAAEQQLAGSNESAAAGEAALAEQNARAAASVAESALTAASAQLAGLEAGIAADNARFSDPAAENQEALALAAGRAQREANLAERRHQLLAAEQAASLAQQALAAAGETPDEKTRQAATAAEAKVAEARAAVAAAEGELASTSPNYTPLDGVYPATSTGRRLALARWITRPENPLAARVAINHIWLRHFGKPLVPTVFDFGINGQPPSHPELLDWLAVELIESGWRMKDIHRLIVTSDAWCRDSSVGAADSPNIAADPDNRYLWRANRRRMEAEAVRDSLLCLAGQLDSSMGGPDIDHQAGETSRRRSVYFQHANEKQMTMLKLFDAASVNECYRRVESIVPQQALALANSGLAASQARLLAAELTRSQGSGPPADDPFVLAAFEQVLCRPPSAAEAAQCRQFLLDQQQLFENPQALTAFSSGSQAQVKPSADPAQRARENLVHVLLNHNDFVTIR